MFSDDMRLSLGLDKCAKLPVTRGKIGLSGPLKLSHDVDIRELNTGEFYKYLGFFESEGLDCGGSKQQLLKAYMKR